MVVSEYLFHGNLLISLSFHNPCLSSPLLQLHYLYLSVFFYYYLSIFLYLSLLPSLSMYLSIYLSINLSTYLSTFIRVLSSIETFVVIYYVRGESYLDVIARLEPIIMEMERHREPLLIVGHQGLHIYSSSCIYLLKL